MYTIDAWQRAGAHHAFGRHRIFYRREGTGAPLLCLHGFPTASWDWCKVWPGLTAAFDCVAPDFLGFGFSDKPADEAYAITTQADLCESLCADLGITSAYILAHDYGDTVAQELLARFGERRNRRERGLTIHACCFLNGGLFPGFHRPRFIQTLLASPIGPVLSRAMGKGRFGRSLAAVFGPDTQPTAGEIDAFWDLMVHNDGRRVMAKLIGYMRERRQYEKRWTGVLLKPVVPMRLIDGPLDPVSGAHLAGHYRDVVPGADVIELDGIGHYPQFEAPDATLHHVLTFLRLCAEERHPASSN